MWKELESKRIGVFDTETDGFLESMTTMHCATVIDAHTKAVLSTQDSQELLDELDKYDVLVGHNIIGFDLPMLYQQFGWRPRPDVIIIDTLWLSRMYHPDIDGGHSLGAWGVRLGNPKEEYYPVLDPDQPVYDPEVLASKLAAEKQGKSFKFEPCWTGSIYTKRMGKYCDQDVDVNVDVFWKLVKLLKNFTWKSIKCEMDTAIIIQRQMQHGFVFDMVSAEKLHAKLVARIIELEEEVHASFKPLPKEVRVVQPKVKKDGTVSSVGLNKVDRWEEVIPVPEHTRRVLEEENYRLATEFDDDSDCFWDEGKRMCRYIDKCETIEYHSGSFTLLEWPEFSLGSRQQIAERLERAGYTLTKKTDKGNPIVDDVVLQEAADSGIPEAKPLAEYFLIQKREAMVKDWIAKARWHEDEGVWRVHGYVNSMGANSHRMTHSSPNVAQVPSAHSPYGKECRSLFTVRKGYRLVGCDASGLELRTLAHYMGDKDYIKTLLEGDIHTANQEAAGLPTRDNAKTFIYAFLYGAGDAKIGSIVGGKSKQGKELKAKFLESTPALKKLREGVLSVAKDRGWLRGFDGRILRVRSPHSALNTLLQGMGAIVMKYWLIEVTKNADAEGLDWNPSANVHDEGQFEVLQKDVPRFKEICEQAFLTISEELGSACLLEGEAMDGSNWYETH